MPLDFIPTRPHFRSHGESSRGRATSHRGYMQRAKLCLLAAASPLVMRARYPLLHHRPNPPPARLPPLNPVSIRELSRPPFGAHPDATAPSVPRAIHPSNGFSPGAMIQLTSRAHPFPFASPLHQRMQYSASNWAMASTLRGQACSPSCGRR